MPACSPLAMTPSSTHTQPTNCTPASSQTQHSSTVPNAPGHPQSAADTAFRTGRSEVLGAETGWANPAPANISVTRGQASD